MLGRDGEIQIQTSAPYSPNGDEEEESFLRGKEDGNIPAAIDTTAEFHGGVSSVLSVRHGASVAVPIITILVVPVNLP